MTEHSSNKGGYALAFIAGAIGGAVLAKRAPALLAGMQEHCQQMCQQMMEGGCCAPPKDAGSREACCEAAAENGGPRAENQPESQAA